VLLPSRIAAFQVNDALSEARASGLNDALSVRSIPFGLLRQGRSAESSDPTPLNTAGLFLE
jgi:hypothetical protein